VSLLEQTSHDRKRGHCQACADEQNEHPANGPRGGEDEGEVDQDVRDDRLAEAVRYFSSIR
jgi:hypothetical protein